MSSTIDYSMVPENWKVVPLGDVIVKIVGGGTPSKSNKAYWEGGIPWLTVKDMRSRRPTDSIDHISERAVEESSTNIIPADSVIIATRIGLGKVVRVPYDAAINQDLKALITPAEIDKGYLEYWIVSIADYLESIGSGTTVKGIRLEQVRSLAFPLAPLEQQKRIVAEIEKQFSRLDEAVANLKRVKANLKRYKAAVLKAAVEGKLTEEWRKQHPDVESADKLLERILAERREKWEQAELAKMEAKGKLPKNDKWKGRYKEAEPPKSEDTFELPETWTWTNLGQLAWSVKDGPHYSPKYSETGIPFISGGNIRPEGIDFEKTKYISRELHEKLSERCKPEVGDLLYTKGGTTGIARINTEEREFNVWVHVAVLRLVDPIEKFYLQLCLNSMHCYQQSQRYTHGVGNQDLGLTRMVWITVPLPPVEEQAQIILEIEKHVSVISEVENDVDMNLRRADQVRQSILKKAFSGELIAQDPNDEPASILLEKIKLVKDQTSGSTKTSKGRKGTKVKSGKSKRPLLEVIRNNPDGISPEALLTEANYSLDEIDMFYEQLALIRDSIVQEKPIGKEAYQWPESPLVILKPKGA